MTMCSDSEDELSARRSARLSASRSAILAAATENLQKAITAGTCSSKAAKKKGGEKGKKGRGKGSGETKVKSNPKSQDAWPNQERRGPVTQAGRPKKKSRNKPDEVASGAEASPAAAAHEEPEEEAETITESPLKKKPARKRTRVDPTQKPSGINAGDID